MFSWIAVLGAKGAKVKLSKGQLYARNGFFIFAWIQVIFQNLALTDIPNPDNVQPFPKGVRGAVWSGMKLIHMATTLFICGYGAAIYGFKISLALGGLAAIKEKSTSGTAAEKSRYKNILKVLKVVVQVFIMSTLGCLYCFYFGFKRINCDYHVTNWSYANLSMANWISMLTAIFMIFAYDPPLTSIAKERGIFSGWKSTVSKYSSKASSANSSASTASSVAGGSTMSETSKVSVKSTMEDADI